MRSKNKRCRRSPGGASCFWVKRIYIRLIHAPSHVDRVIGEPGRLQQSSGLKGTYKVIKHHSIPLFLMLD
ncbi:hypothetical protein HMPREF9374_3111 [Desmospora sp. 8437]|nr:hypothetical protein HMPREF9374_3111 [Desmospora sp. 8437]